VINYANNTDRANSLLSELHDIPTTTTPILRGKRFHAIKADVGVKASVQAMVKETIEEMERLDVVVSNAGW